MPDDIYTRDILVWSGQQADLLRRLARGERVNAEIDWENVIEEVESVGRSELTSVRSLLTRALERLMKVHGWPDGPVNHWRQEAKTFLLDARRSWTPTMETKLNLTRTYRDALFVTVDRRIDGRLPRPIPETCPFTRADLEMQSEGPPDIDALLARLAAAGV
jgi:hypothetical protein